MTLGRAFANPFSDGRTTDYDRWLAEALAELSAVTGDTLPAVLWVAKSVTLTREATIPQNVVLTFAPGAVITLSAPPGSATPLLFSIKGPIDAGMERRFAPEAGTLFILQGPLTEIHAAWWHPVPTAASAVVSGAAALQHALDVLWYRYLNDLEPAPIALSGPYVLDGEVSIKPPPALVRRSLPYAFDVILRGRHFGPADPPTFAVKDSNKVEMDSMLAVDGRVILTLENVGFDLRRSPGRPVVSNALLFRGYHDRTRIEGCYFKLGTANGIVFSNPAAFDAPPPEPAPPAKPVPPASLPRFAFGDGDDPAARVEVSRCVFEGAAPTSVGVRAEYTVQVFLWVVDSQFRGTYGAGIAVVGSELTVTACTFDNAAEGGVVDQHYIADIYLGSLEPVTGPLRPPAHKDLTKSQRTFVGKDRQFDHSANAHLTVTHCVSTSATFLFGDPVFFEEEPGGAMLTNVLHLPPPGATERGAWSVRWSPRYESRSLILQGCELGAPIQLGGNLRPGVVVDLGSRATSGVGEQVVVVGGGVEPVVSPTTGYS